MSSPSRRAILRANPSASVHDTLSWASHSASTVRTSACWMKVAAASSTTVASWAEATAALTVVAWVASATVMASRA
jgi:hypothetical protein